MSTLNVDKVDPSTGTALELGTSGDTITVPSGATFVVAGTTEITGTNNVQRPNAQPLIYNGDAAIAQRGASQTGVSSGASYPVDRFQFYLSSLGTYTIIQEALTSGAVYDQGFRTALRIDTTTADASPSAADYAYLAQKFEGRDLQVLKKGTSNAEKLTLAFWVKSNKTTTGQVNLWDYDNSRIVSGTYTTDVTNTWEKKIIVFAADTSDPLTNDNNLSFGIEWFLDSGSNFTSGTAPTAWEDQVNGDRNVSNFGIGSSTDNDFAITGVQLEVGEYTSSTIPPFQFESFGDNLNRCQRYFNRVTSGQTSQRLVIGENVNTSSNAPIFQHHPPLRAAPGLTVDNVGQFLIYSSASTYAATNIVTDVMNTKSSSLVVTVTGTMGAGNAGQFVAHATAKLDFSAEL
jgi:hypothetical protein